MDAVAGYAGAFAIGLILGLMGGGGSILTVPLLVYVMALSPVTATAYSLFIVGTTSAVGSAQNYFKGNVAIKTGLLIALPSFIAVYITRRYIVPQLPDVLFKVGYVILRKEVFIMLLFAFVMALAAYSMLKKRPAPKEEDAQLKYIYILPFVIIVGLLMGLVGAGGGFLIIPMLVFFGGLTMRKAVGTSLFIIALNTLMGFLGDIQTMIIDWGFLLTFTLISIFGIFAGTYLQRFINDTQLRKGFGWFVLLMACFILSKEIIGY
jgi:uncharacterized membrane protein YfcA